MGARHTTRRALLARLSGATVAGSLGGLALGPPQARPAAADAQWAAATDLELGARLVGDGGELSEPDAPRWQYARRPTGFEPTSPVNAAVVTGHGRDLGDVVATFRRAGWQPGPEEYVRYAPAPDGRFEPVHAALAETVMGSTRRHHVRCWAFDGVVWLQLHEDGVPRPGHPVTSYRRTRALAERLFADAGWTVAPAAVDAGNAKDDHDGTLTVIEP